MLKTGRFRALRNLPIGWALQVIHATDRSQTVFRAAVEVALVAVAVYGLVEAGRSFGEVERNPGSVLRCRA